MTIHLGRFASVTLSLLATILPISASPSETEVQLFRLNDVRLLPGPFLEAQERNREYLLAHDVDRLLAPFRREAGLEPEAAPYPNWENTGLDGHIGGHYLTALAQMAAITGHESIRQRLDHMLAELRKCAEAGGDGYIGGIPGGRELWQEVAAGKIDAEPFSLNGRWVPWYNLHKTFAGLRDAWLLTKNEDARVLLVGLAEWCERLVANLSDEQIQDMLRSEHGGMNEVLADVYAITGEARFLELARRFSHRELLEPLQRGEDRLDGLHANTQIPKVLGYGRIGELADDPEWMNAAEFFWRVVVADRTVSIGGNSVAEHFHPVDDFSAMIESHEGVETCNTYNMMRLTEQLFRHQPLDRYAAFHERALFNHILSSQHPEHGGFVYFTPMRPRHYRVYSQPEVCFWCCVGSGMENHGRHGQFIYAHDDDGLYVNLFVASELHWKDRQVRIRQETEFPARESSRLVVSTDTPAEFVLNIRRPRWTDGGDFQIRINDEPLKRTSRPGSYVPVEREWKNGDVVEISLPMQLSLVRMPDGSDYAAIRYGPIVLAGAVEGPTPGLIADDDRWAHIASGEKLSLTEAPSLNGSDAQILEGVRSVEGEPLVFELESSVKPDRWRGLRLQPFYTIHDSRYMLYWPIADND